MSDGMEEIIDDFITEAEESLEKIDPLFVELEEKGYDSELMNGIFRSVHTIKGAAGFLGFQDIVDVSHKTESLLKKLRDGDMDVSSSLITLILKSVDMLKALLQIIHSKGARPDGMDSLLEELDSTLVAATSETATSETATSETATSETTLKGPPAAEPTMQEKADLAVEESALEWPAEPKDPDEPKDEIRLSEDTHVPPVLSAEEVPEAAEPAVAAFQEVTPEIESMPEPEPGLEVDKDHKEASMAKAVSMAIDSVLSVGDDAPAQEAGVVPKTEAQAQKPAVAAPTSDEAEAQKKAVYQQQAQAGKSVMQTLRVDVNRIDKVMNLTGEIVLVRNRLLNIAGYLDQKYAGDDHVDGLQESVSFLDLITADLQLGVMKMRMQPIKKVFGKFPRLVRDISQNLGKDVHLSISGEGTEVDRTVIERIGDPLVHIIRNAIDHGIESIAERLKKGKSAKGLVEISAYQQGSQIIIEVSDDGRGINVPAIKAKALQNGLVTEEEAQRMTDKEAISLIFNAGFTTVEVASELSGRGVGMDVVKTNIAKLNGYVDIMTTKDAGTTVRINIPLTLAIIQALMVRAGGVQYAIPLGVIEETIKITQEDIDNVTGQPVLRIRDRVFTMAELTDVLNSPPPEHAPEDRYVLVIAVGDRHFCIAVDELLGQEEVVIKAIDGIDTDTTGILGATITGEGKIVLILDPSGMSRVVAGLKGI